MNGKAILFETLAVKNNEILNLEYHNHRFIQGQIFLEKKIIEKDISKFVHSANNNKLIRCRVIYDKDTIEVDCFEYIPKQINSFKIIECNEIDYTHKYYNRELLSELLIKKQNCDEIIIIKNNFVTDCTIGNLLFLNDGRWYTPDTPLLKGTQRQFLLDNKKIQLATIKKDDIKNYQKLMMINALNPFDEYRAIDVECVV